MCSLFFPSRPSFCKYVFQLRGGGSGHRTQALEQESAICIQTQPWTCFSEPHFFACKMAVTGRLPLLGGSREVLHESACTLCGKEQQQPQFFPAHLSQRRVPAPIHHTGPNPELSLVLTLPHSHQTTHRRELRISPALSPPPPAPRSTLRSSPVPGLRRGLPAHVLTPTLASLQLVPGKAAGVIFSRCKSNHVISPVPASLKASRDFLLFSG